MSISWIVLVVLLFVLVPLAVAGISFAPWVPTWQVDVDRALRLAQVKPGEGFYDLGCGDGKAVFAAAKLGAKATGIEIAWPLYVFCQIKKLLCSSSARFRLGNLFHLDVSAADVIYIFGMPRTIQQKLRDKLERELKPGTRVVSYAFPIHGWEAVSKDKPTPKQMSIYLYRSGSVHKRVP